MNVLQILWSAVNSPIGITVIAAIVLWLLNKLYANHSLWQRYEGTIIAAVKFAEKHIPNNTPNKAIAKLDTALQYVIKVYEDVVNRRATNTEIASLREGIQIKHSELEKAGNLKCVS